MQQSLIKATEEMGQVRKLLAALQVDMTEIKEANVGLRTDVDGCSSYMTQRAESLSWKMRTAHRSAKKCEELHQAIEDAANRDRRQNLRLISLWDKLEKKFSGAGASVACRKGEI